MRAKVVQKQGLVRVAKFPLIIFISLCFLKGTKEEMDALENRFLAGSYLPVSCANTDTPAENKKASDIGKKSDSTTRTEPPKEKAKKGNKENSGTKTENKAKRINKDKEIKRQVKGFIFFLQLPVIFLSCRQCGSIFTQLIFLPCRQRTWFNTKSVEP